MTDRELYINYAELVEELDKSYPDTRNEIKIYYLGRAGECLIRMNLDMDDPALMKAFTYINSMLVRFGVFTWEEDHE